MKKFSMAFLATATIFAGGLAHARHFTPPPLTEAQEELILDQVYAWFPDDPDVEWRVKRRGFGAGIHIIEARTRQYREVGVSRRLVFLCQGTRMICTHLMDSERREIPRTRWDIHSCLPGFCYCGE